MSESLFSIDRSDHMVLSAIRSSNSEEKKYIRFSGHRIDLRTERIAALQLTGGMLPAGTQFNIQSMYGIYDAYWTYRNKPHSRKLKNGKYAPIPRLVRRLGRYARERPDIANTKAVEWVEIGCGKYQKQIAACDECGEMLLRNAVGELQCCGCGLIHEEIYT